MAVLKFVLDTIEFKTVPNWYLCLGPATSSGKEILKNAAHLYRYSTECSHSSASQEMRLCKLHFLGEATTQRSSTNIPPNSPRLGEEASEDPEGKVQEAAIEIVQYVGRFQQRPKENIAASECMIVFNCSGLVNRLCSYDARIIGFHSCTEYILFCIYVTSLDVLQVNNEISLD